MNIEKTTDYIKAVGVSLIIIAIMMLFTGCGVIDLRNKAIAAESKVIGMELEAPSIAGADTAFCKIRLGFIATKYTSAPAGGKAEIKDEYKDLSLWQLSGSATSELKADNQGAIIP